MKISKFKKILLIIGALIVLSVLAGGVWGLLFIRIYRVPTGAMMNTIIPGDRVLTILDARGNLNRGEIVVFKLPNDQKVEYINRIIGLPGETIQLRGSKVFINGKELPEARTYINLSNDVLQDPGRPFPEISREGEGNYRVYYIKHDDASDEIIGAKYAVVEPYVIPQGHYFILGDCRDNSLDSRFWGTVPRELIIGRGLMIYDSAAPGGEKRAFTRLQ
ncbi:MAG: signal peptidase I [Acidobacteria bacterium]|nr:signal peptidase I [Acidobacteriota bacterium]